MTAAIDVIWARNLLRPIDFGGSRYHWEVTRRLAESGNLVRVIVPRPRGPLPGHIQATLRYYPTSNRHPLLTFLTNAALSQPAIRAEIRRRHPDAIVLSSYDVAYGHFVLTIGRRTVPTVFIYHGSFYSDAVNRLAWPSARSAVTAFMRAVERHIFRSATALIAVSPFSRFEIEARLGRPDERIRLVPTGVDTEFFTPGDRGESRRRLGLPQDARILLTVGRLAPVKRYDRAIDALAQLRGRDDRYLLLLAGQGPEAAALQRRAEQVRLGVRFCGYAEGERLRDMYRAADLVLCTSEFENWSVAILEALACGTPVVGTPRGSTPDLLGLVDEQLVLADTDPTTLAASIQTLFAAGRLRAIGERAALVISSRFSWDGTAAAIAQVVRDVAKH